MNFETAFFASMVFEAVFKTVMGLILILSVAAIIISERRKK